MTSVSQNTPVSQRIALHGLQLIEASAGTGKTYTIATLFVRLLLERPATVEQILVVTYTRAATAELQDRIRRRLVEALDAWSADTAPNDLSLRALWETRSATERALDIKRLRIAVGNYDRAAIHTIHGFCQRVLNDHAFHSDAPLQPDLLMTERPLLQEVVHDFWARHTYDAPRYVLDGIQIKGTLEALERLARDTLHRRDAAILPSNFTPEPLPSPDAFFDAKAQLAAAWRKHGTEVIALMSKWPTLKQNTYAHDTIAERWGGTISAYLNGTDIEPPKELRKLGTEMLADSTKGGAPPPSLSISPQVDALITAATPIAQAVARWKLQLRLNLIHEVRTEVDRRKREHDQLAFDDLLRQLRTALESAQGATLIASLRAAYPVALVDEFQDTDPVQYAIFQAIYRAIDTRHGLFLIGDPKQAIYRFRGADVFAYMDAVRAVDGQPHRLRDNWRSDPALIDAVNAVFARRKQPFVYTAIGFEPATPAPTAKQHLTGPAAWTKPLCFVVSDDDDKQRSSDAQAATAEQTARHIGHTLAAGVHIDGQPVAPRDFAVLCRTNKQAALVQEALRALRIPTARDGDSSVFDTPTALELDRILSAVAQPEDPTLLRVALTTTILGVDASTLLSLDDEHDASAWESWVARFRDWNVRWLHRGFTPMVQRLLTQEGVHARLLGLTDGERRLTDLMHLTELLQRQASEHHVGPLSLVQWLRTLRTDEDARAEVDETQIRLESDAHAVKLTTIHRSKGLEYPIVYCPYLWHLSGKAPTNEDALVFHGDASAASLAIDVNTEKDARHKELNAEESLSEDLRLTYVALTRARHRCVVSWCNTTGSNKTALAYLLGSETNDTSTDKKTKGKKSSDDDPGVLIRNALTALKAQCEHGIAIESPLSDAPPEVPRASANSTTLSARVRTRRLPPGLRITSFSRLIERDARLGREAEEGYDHDTHADTDTISSTTLSANASQLIALADVRAGADVGLLVHDVLEHSDFAASARDALATRMRQSAPRHGIDVATATQLETSVVQALDTPFGTDALHFSLADIALSDRLAELEFMFPVSSTLTANNLADVLERHEHGISPDYSARLRGLGFQTFAGFLRGYIDLCFTRDGRFYVLDYKTNHLGRLVDDYAQTSLQRAMGEHHYYLQALVYSVALHRHLRLRVRDYNYDQHFGGFLYLFLRGMAPTHPLGTGVLYGRPSAALMTDLSRLLEGSAS